MLRIAFPLVLALVSAQLYACSCIAPPPPKEALAAASAVFSGKVTAIEAAGDHEKAVTIEIKSTWKGVEKKKEVVVYTADNGATCGYGFEKGKSYLVYASLMKRGDDKVLGTNICTRTAALDAAAKDIKELGEPMK
jgi:hypothetical protein